MSGLRHFDCDSCDFTIAFADPAGLAAIMLTSTGWRLSGVSSELWCPHCSRDRVGQPKRLITASDVRTFPTTEEYRSRDKVYRIAAPTRLGYQRVATMIRSGDVAAWLVEHMRREGFGWLLDEQYLRARLDAPSIRTLREALIWLRGRTRLEWWVELYAPSIPADGEAA